MRTKRRRSYSTTAQMFTHTSTSLRLLLLIIIILLLYINTTAIQPNEMQIKKGGHYISRTVMYPLGPFSVKRHRLRICGTSRTFSEAADGDAQRRRSTRLFPVFLVFFLHTHTATWRRTTFFPPSVCVCI